MKLQKLSEITATLPFTEFDFLQKYRDSFKTSELGRIHEQLPLKELMRHGMTATPIAIDAMLNDPDTLIRTLQALKSERERADSEKQRADKLEIQRDTFNSENRRLQKLHTGYLRQLEAQAPKVEYADNVLSSDSTYTTTQIAKELGMSAQALNKMLHRTGVIFRQSGQWLLYAKYQSKGFMKTRTYTYPRSDGRMNTMMVSVWTEAGRMFLHELMKSHFLQSQKLLK